MWSSEVLQHKPTTRSPTLSRPPCHEPTVAYHLIEHCGKLTVKAMRLYYVSKWVVLHTCCDECFTSPASHEESWKSPSVTSEPTAVLRVTFLALSFLPPVACAIQFCEISFNSVEKGLWRENGALKLISWHPSPANLRVLGNAKSIVLVCRLATSNSSDPLQSYSITPDQSVTGPICHTSWKQKSASLTVYSNL